LPGGPCTLHPLESAAFSRRTRTAVPQVRRSAPETLAYSGENYDLRSGTDLAAGLARYERRCAALSGHRFVINDFGKRSSLSLIERLMFAAATKDVGLARHVNRFGARIDGPGRFLSPRAISKAIWVNLRSPAASDQGTRRPLGSVPDEAPTASSPS